jgi:hypothetical protein
MDRRTDYKTALLIENMIHEGANRGRPGVARELADMGVPLEVTLRVLTRPAERRNQLPSLDLPPSP